jgi:CheY-like chemotaxis protein
VHDATVLIVDDEPVVRALLKAALELTGSRLVEAADGGEAVDTAWRERPDLVLLDIGLPTLNGLDVCRALKTNPEAPRVLLITGNAEVADMDTCGADGVLVKPFNALEIAETVRRELALSRASAA